MLDSPEPIDFGPLIKALEQANKATTFDGQKAELELALVAVELNPSPNDFCEMLWSLETLAGIDITTRNWTPVEDHFEESV
jgi:hypothetical protein